MTIPLCESDRVLFFAPHPDDEGLAAAGLLQRAALVGARAHLVFATNGDNNVWAQRCVERRWQIAESDRLRWGELRKREVRAAVQAMSLGKQASLRFLNLPDQEITSLLRKVPARLSAILREEIDQFKPTLVIAPSVYDAHPDHSALSVAIGLALERSEHPSTRCYSYIIHHPRQMPPSQIRELRLTDGEQRKKRNAIDCYRSQLHLFPTRFTRFARPTEIYYESDPPETVATRYGFEMSHTSRHLNLEIDAPALLRSAREILFVFSPCDVDPITWRINLRFRRKPLVLEDAGTGVFLRQIEGKKKLSYLQISLPIALLPESRTAYLKIVARALFFDRFGWFKIALPSRKEADLIAQKRQISSEAKQLSLSETPLDPEAL
jgi:LmbE family N-acetylglucosaminyl deacetylase